MATTIRVMPDGSGIATDNVKWVIVRFAKSLSRKHCGSRKKQTGEVVLITVGQSTWQEQLRTGLAIWAPIAQSW